MVPIAGTYSGNYSGDESGTWSLIVNFDGYATGTIYSPDGNISMEGGVGSDGRAILISDEGAGIYGIISGYSVSGTWVNNEDGMDGTFRGGAYLFNKGDDIGSDGGGGGCFTKALIH